MKVFIRMRTHRPQEGLARDTGWTRTSFKGDVMVETEGFFTEETGWRKIGTCMAGETIEKAYVIGWIFSDDEADALNEVYCVMNQEDKKLAEATFISEKLLKECDGDCDSCNKSHDDDLKDMECAGNA